MLGDDPEAAVSFAVGRQQPAAVSQGILVGLDVFGVEFAPVAGGVAAQAFLHGAGDRGGGRRSP